MLTKALISRAFKKAGLYPVDCGVFGLEDFAPSKALSIVPNVPPSFPADVASSDVEVTSSNAKWRPGSDMDEEDISWRDADENRHASEEPQPGMPTEGHALVPVPDQVSQPSEGPGNDLDAAPDTEHVTKPVTGFMIAMANLEAKVGPMMCSQSAHINSTAPAMPKIVSFEKMMHCPEKTF
jgi:hypothetical protein